jgi:hypothetical protein
MLTSRLFSSGSKSQIPSFDMIFRPGYFQGMEMSGVTFFFMPDYMVNQVQIQALTIYFMVRQALSYRPGDAQTSDQVPSESCFTLRSLITRMHLLEFVSESSERNNSLL